MAKVHVRYWAAAKEAAGIEAEYVDAGSLADVLEAVLSCRTGDGGRFAAVLARSSVLVDGTRVSRQAAATTFLSDQAVIEVLPPFAGG